MEDKKEQYPKGHFVGKWIGIGIAMFTGLGIPLSIALDNTTLIGIGPAIGVAFGAGIGASIEAKKKKEGFIRELTDKEKKRKKSSEYIGLGILIIGLVAMLTLFLLLRS